MKNFEMNGKTYRTDLETYNVLKQVIDSYRKGGSVDASAVSAVMYLGISTGRIKEL